MKSSTVVRFYKSHRDRLPSNPARRWVYHKLLAATTCATTIGIAMSYQSAKHSAANDGHLCGSFTHQVLGVLPLHFLSTLVGSAASSLAIPSDVHQRMIEWYIWFYNVDMSDVDGTVGSFNTLEEFFVRSLKKDARPIASDSAAVLVSPVDGIVLTTDDVIVGPTSSKLVQVKGVQYTLQNLFRTAVPPLAPGFERKVLAISLQAKHYHHVHAPCAMHVQESVFVPGTLLPMTVAGFRWIENIFASNERICIRASKADGAGYSAGQSSPTVSNLWMALVGGTLRGKIDLKFEARISTNLPEPPMYAVHFAYKNNEKKCSRGEDIARFRWGSAVLVVVDVPAGAQWCVKPLQEVRVGEAVLQAS